MTSKELIQELKKLPQDVKVFHLWDGAARTEINFVWLSKDGKIVTADYDSDCYYDSDRPIDAPTEEEDKHWKTPEDPEEALESHAVEIEAAYFTPHRAMALKGVDE